MVFLVARPVAPRPGDPRGERARRDPVRQRHRARRSAARSCAPFLAQYLKDGAPRADVAPVTAFETGTNTWRRLNAWPRGLRERLPHQAHAALSRRRPEAGLRRAEGRRRGVRRVRVRSREARAVPRPPDPVRGLRRRQRVAALAGRATSARRPAGRTSLTFVSDVADGAGEDRGRAGREPRRLDERHRLGLGGEADRRLPGRGRRQPEMGGYQLMVSADIFRGRYRESLETPKAIAADKPLALQVRPADGEPRLPAGAPDHGAGAVELVPALRPQPADLRAEHLLGEAGGLPEGDAARLPRAGTGELHRAARS